METARMRRSTLQRKDREQLTAIASTLGKKPPIGARKGEIIDLILDLVSDSSSNDVTNNNQNDSLVPEHPPAPKAPVLEAPVATEPSMQVGAAQTSEQSPKVSAPLIDSAAKETNGDVRSTNQQGDEVAPRRRRRGREREANKDTNETYVGEVVSVEGYLELRPEGYGFLRVDGALPSKDDAYVPVKMVRQYNLDKGVHLVGTSRPAARNEKNPAIIELHTINGAPPEAAVNRVAFDELVAVFPNERLLLAGDQEPFDYSAPIVDLLTPLGKGQRALLVSPPRAGKTTLLKHLVRAIEQNHTDVEVLVLLVDERPEEITDMERYLTRGEVISSPFDQVADEQITIAEMTIERAKRAVEDGKDVCLLVDGITRLARAYTLATAHGGRYGSATIERTVVYACKRFLAAARNIDGGGSLTMIATALVDSGSSLDDLIYQELARTANLELRLSADLAVRRIYPAVDVAASGTHNEELLLTAEQLEHLQGVRRHLMTVASSADARVGDDVLALLSDLSAAKEQ